MSWPFRETRPLSGRSKPARMRRRVVLPQPLGPSREKNSPLLMASETSATARMLPKRFETFSNSKKAPCAICAEWLPPACESILRRL
mgnify:CR=1 FL=1